MGAFKIFRKFSQLLDRTTVDLPAINAPLSQALDTKVDSSSLSYVALSGSYDDLIDVPSPSPGVSEVADLTDATTYDFPNLNTPLVNALAGKSSTGHTHSNAEVNTAIAASPATSASAMGLGTGDAPTFAGIYSLSTAGIESASQGNAILKVTRNDNINYSAMLNYYSGNSLKWTAGLSDAGDFTGSTGLEYLIGSGSKNNPVFLISSSNNVGIGTTTPAEKLDVVGNIKASGTVTAAGATFNGLVSQTGLGGSTYFGEGAGVADDLSDNNNTGVGYQALQATTTGTLNVASGAYSLRFNTIGTGNVATGYQALKENTTGNYNVASGVSSLSSNTTGANNVANGVSSLFSNTSGSGNVASGVNSLLSNTTGGYNVASGFNSLRLNTTGSYNVANGYQSGRYIANGTTANATSSNSLYLGADTKALASGDTNEIVIGYAATGIGSNTVTLGNSSIVTTALKGNVGIGTTAPTGKLNIETASSQTALQAGDLGTLLSTSSASTSNTTHTTSPYLKMLGGIWNGSVNTDRGFIQQIVGVSGANYGYRLNIGSTDIASAMSIVGVSGNVGIGTASPAEKLDVVGNIKASGVLKKGVLTVGTLPGSPTAGMSSYVTDSSQTLAAGIGTTLVAAGGGTEYFNPVHYNGTNWIIG